jgi:hypothetical protein
MAIDKNNRNALTRYYSGKFGDQFVLKVTRSGNSMLTKYADRSGVVLSVTQKARNRLFREAVAYAKALIADPVRRKELLLRLRKNKKTRTQSAYHAAIRQYMKENSPKVKLKKIAKILQNYLDTFTVSERQLEAVSYMLNDELMTNALYQEINKVSKPTATRDLQEMVGKGIIQASGRGAGAKYSLIPLPGKVGE